MESDCEAMSRFRRNAAVLAAVSCLISAVAALHGCGPHQAPPAPSWPDITLTPQDRILVLAPHPDDEVIACGGIIQHAQAMGLPIRIVFFTYGDNNQWSFAIYRKHPVLLPKAVQDMGVVRHDEALAAARIFGLSPDRLTFLGYPDFGTMPIWKAHWADQPPFRGMLTRVITVPYATALRPGAPYKGEEILHDLTTVLREFRPTKVFVSHPADHMPDHSALYLFTRVALWDLEREFRPDVYPYLVHFKRWPKPRGYNPAKPLEPPAAIRDQIPWQAHRLRPDEVERKRQALVAHRTQYAYGAGYLLSFVRADELFGDFPSVVLQPGPSTVSLGAGAAVGTPETPEELTEEERAAFVGIEIQSVRLEQGELVFSIAFSRPLAEAVQASVFAFGYRADRPFPQMPKLHVSLGMLNAAVSDQHRKLPTESVRINRQPKALTLRVPLQALGDPQRILISARTSLGEVPLDWASWRVLELPAAQ